MAVLQLLGVFVCVFVDFILLLNRFRSCSGKSLLWCIGPWWPIWLVQGMTSCLKSMKTPSHYLKKYWFIINVRAIPQKCWSRHSLKYIWKLYLLYYNTKATFCGSRWMNAFRRFSVLTLLHITVSWSTNQICNVFLIYRSHFSLKNSMKTPHSSPVRVRYGTP